MDDLILRAAAIEALSTPCDKRYRHGVWETCLDNIETAIKHIPAVDAAPVVHGRWILEQNGSGVCSVCNRSDHIDRLAKNCRFCGARMDGGENGAGQ